MDRQLGEESSVRHTLDSVGRPNIARLPSRKTPQLGEKFGRRSSPITSFEYGSTMAGTCAPDAVYESGFCIRDLAP